ncbi:MAG: diversity-generating retroelement protein Avd [Selenomonadaceae bacterium]
MAQSEIFNKAKNPLMLQTKFEEIQVYTHDTLVQFPKRERFLLCAEINSAVDEAMHLIIRMKLRYFKKTTLQDIDVEIDYLRTLVREADALKYISHGKLNEWMSHLDEAGCILGGLVKYYSAKAKEKTA